ncbi:MAG: hypothetical protein V3U27_08185 [Candidatus Tectomicrobia bacterium]
MTNIFALFSGIRDVKSKGSHVLQVNIRLTHRKQSAAEHRVIIAPGVIGQDAPAMLDTGSDPVGQANAARTRLTASG